MGSEYGGGGWVRGAGPPTTLPDLRNTNPPPYNNGNSGHSQSQSRKSGGGGGGGGYSNSQYSRGGERSYRPNYTSEEQRRTHNTPAELSDGEQEEQEPAQQPQEQAGPKGGHSYRNKRHNRQHHDNT